LRQRLEKWLERAPKLERDVAARESFSMGSEAIRHLVFDPLLPDPLVDVGERRAFVETLLRYDRAGHAIWHAFLKPLRVEEAARSLSLQ
jgi:phenylacetic acid degradation operon negative regulatory protein